MTISEAIAYLEINQHELESAFDKQFPHLSVGGFCNPRARCVSSSVIEFTCHYDGYDNEDDSWTWFYNTVTNRFSN